MKGSENQMQTINTQLDLETCVRIQVLHDVVRNLCTDFGLPDSIIDVLYKGIVEKQLLATISAYYIDFEDNAVGMVEFKIDWQKHELYAVTDTGKEITIRKQVSLMDQFAEWSHDIVNYVNDMRKALGVEDIKVYFSYKDEIKKNPRSSLEADVFLGLVNATVPKKFNDAKEKEFIRKMGFTSEMLPELRISIESRG